MKLSRWGDPSYQSGGVKQDIPYQTVRNFQDYGWLE